MIPDILPTTANETVGEEIGDFCPVFNNAFARPAQSVETLWNALRHTDRKRQFLSLFSKTNTHTWQDLYGFLIQLTELSELFHYKNNTKAK